MHIITVGELNRYIKNKFDSDSNLFSVCVRGEISNFKHHYTGHMYMSIKDDSGSIRAVMFRSNASALKFEPKSGMSVIVTGRVGVYERDGQYQIYIDAMIPDGIGRLYAAYEQLKEQLEKEGYFDLSHKRQIPRYPSVVGVVTSPTGAAVRDIINVISRRFPLADIKIYPALVQGEGAAESICRGIEFFNRGALADVLIVGRGGGSIEDLWAFNEKSVAMAVYNSKIPVISAVGHETDFTIADFVADLRAPTPSAAAEVATPSASELEAMLTNSRARLLSSLTELIRHKRTRLEALTSRTVFARPASMLDDKTYMLGDAVRRLERAYKNSLSAFENTLSRCSYKLGALNPVNVLNRGYSVAYTQDGVLKKTSDVLSAGDFKLRLSDGTVECSVKNSRGELNGIKKEL